MYEPGCCDVAYVDGELANVITCTDDYGPEFDVVYIWDEYEQYFWIPIPLN